LRRLRQLSLGARMVIVFGGLLAAIGTFVVVFFPARMADQAREKAEERATAVTQVMSTAMGPAIEFDDEDHARSILTWLSTTRDARFGVVRGPDGKQFAAWHGEAVPRDYVWRDHAAIDDHDRLLVVTLPVRGIGGGAGTIHVGFSLERLEEEHAEAKQAVGVTTGGVFGLGLVATLLLSAFVVRPIRVLSLTARKIASGRLPAVMPQVTGGDEVTELASALHAMLERVNEQSQKELVRASRHAGMAEVATGVLHNVGNVLTSVNVQLELLRERTTAMPVDRLRKLHDLLRQATALDGERLEMTCRYVTVVADALDQYRGEVSRDLDTFGGHVEHIKRVVAMQNAYARVRSVVEPTRIDSLIQEAIELGCSRTRRPDIAIRVDVSADLTNALPIDRHQILQILVNLISNARDAVSGSSNVREIRIAAKRVDQNLEVRVTDTGVGISEPALARIFSAGFTSKPHGHGYGLHSSALTARQLGGALSVTSDGEGRGACFTLTVPMEEPS
jgi:two-component system NtrC family sensor kinase